MDTSIRGRLRRLGAGRADSTSRSVRRLIGSRTDGPQGGGSR
ncbi:MAG: hypothetical protein U0Q08_06590 [Dermatophilaceae bacterium]